MIYEYALEPEMVAAWGDRFNHRIFIREFGLGQGRVLSRYPKKWARKVWDSFDATSEMDRKRLEELLVRLQETMIKRKDVAWDHEEPWLQNALQEHERFPFRAILVKNDPAGHPGVLCEDTLDVTIFPNWDNPHGKIVDRQALKMASAVKEMLSCCRWVKFVDPYISQCNQRHKESLKEFFKILFRERPVGTPEKIEIHTSGDGASREHLENFYKTIIPVDRRIILYRWQEYPRSQRLHNRYILTDLGGVSFQHGLDSGAAGETDDVNRLDSEQYDLRCKQYKSATNDFEKTEDPLEIQGTFGA